MTAYPGPFNEFEYVWPDMTCHACGEQRNQDYYGGLCTMCAPRGLPTHKVCPVCGSCVHICRGANGNNCQHSYQVEGEK